MKDKIKILKTLKDFGRLPSSRIASIVGMNYHSFIQEMRLLKKNDLVIENIETIARYWEITPRGIEELELEEENASDSLISTKKTIHKGRREEN